MFKRTLMATLILAAGGTGYASAQTVILQPDEEVVVREYIVTRPSGPEVVLPDDYDIVVGEPLPETVVVSPLNAPGLARAYEYVVVDGQTLIVEPNTRRVVQVLD